MSVGALLSDALLRESILTTWISSPASDLDRILRAPSRAGCSSKLSRIWLRTSSRSMETGRYVIKRRMSRVTSRLLVEIG
jgi:hypothetical protein